MLECGIDALTAPPVFEPLPVSGCGSCSGHTAARAAGGQFCSVRVGRADYLCTTLSVRASEEAFGILSQCSISVGRT